MNKTLGREAVIEVSGKKYTISRFDRNVLERLLEYVKKHTPDPLDTIRDKLKGFPEAIQHRMIDKAMEMASRPVSMGSPEYQAVMSTPEGALHLFYLLLQSHHPLLTEKEAAVLYDETVKEHGYGHIEALMAKVAGEIPTDDSAVKREVLQGFGLIEADPEKKG